MSYFKTNLYLFSKYNIGSAIAGTAISFLWSVQPYITLLIFLVLSDLITGMFAANHRSEKISSRGLFRTVEKLSVELIAILTAEGVRLVLLPDAIEVFGLVLNFNLTYVVVFVIAMAEFKSIIENIEVILNIKIWKTIKDKIAGR